MYFFHILKKISSLLKSKIRMRYTWMDTLLTNWFIRQCHQMPSCHNVWGTGALKLFLEIEWLGHFLKEKELEKTESGPYSFGNSTKRVSIRHLNDPVYSLGSYAVLWLFKIPKQGSQWDGSVGKVLAAKPDYLSSIPGIHMVKGGHQFLKVALWPTHMHQGRHAHPPIK